MKKTEKLKIIDELLEKENPDYLCNQLWNAIAEREDCCFIHYGIILAYIPEFIQIKPDDKNAGGCWFGDPTIKNLPRRMKALRQLRDIILSS